MMSSNYYYYSSPMMSSSYYYSSPMNSSSYSGSYGSSGYNSYGSGDMYYGSAN